MHRCKYNRTYTQVFGNAHIEGSVPPLAGRVGETNDKTIFHEAEGDCRVRLVIMSTRRRSDARRFLSVAPNKLKESALLNTTCWLLLG